MSTHEAAWATYALRHTTRYAYTSEVDLAAHLAHLTPRALPAQHVLSAALVVEPEPSWRATGIDAFGNQANWFFVEAPHAGLSIELQARVAVEPRLAPQADATPPWSEIVVAAASAGPDGVETGPYLFESPLVDPADEVRDYAERSFAAGRPIFAALLDLNARIHRDFAFRPGLTTVNTPVRQVLAQRAGVCQDFTHLMIAGLRALGLPARYVSGYVCTGDNAFLGADQSHAWVACWLGPRLGWVDLDPTNGVIVADEHVTLGWGRDYGDMSPLRGVLLGGGAHTLAVSVVLHRE